jgi:dolichyl-phosphate-mannose--protein O-mannosyl transferase
MQTARYARITAQSAGLVLYEVGFLDEEGHTLPIAGVSQSGQADQSSTSAAALIDEQRTVAAYPGDLNSTYFDEIYHARTAFEHLHRMNAYEWTHPPLGKVLMMVGIQLFGMTPFGWRFMGALMGVLMVPLMYLLVKQLTKDTRLSFIAMALMALDSMHFTQTRIATIDSYAVFWIMLMYLFMFRYCQMSWNRESLGKTLIPLGLCGVTMGIAWATKWVGLYASAGLAILFFWTVFRRLRESFTLRKAGQARQFSQSMRNLVITLAFCLLFFIVIPLLIYYFSYFWQLRPEGVHTLGDMLSSERVDRVVQLQKSIFDYHAGLGGDTHFFRSPWYQWPVIWWPMWFFSGTEYMPEGMISSISCMGNPAVWWFGLAALIFVIVRMCWVRRASRKDLFVVIGFASQFLPWVIVPRSTFIYHYFASVPFIILASALLLDAIRRKNETAFSAVSGGLLAAAAILFAAFYPLESGLPCSREYAKYLRWFKWYNY